MTRIEVQVSAARTAVGVEVDPSRARVIYALGTGGPGPQGDQGDPGPAGGTDIVQDTSPQLGGNLDLNSFTVGDADAADLTKLNGVTASAAELNHTAGVTSAIQGQLNGKATSAQGALADSATQPGDLATVATSGSYDDLSDLPLQIASAFAPTSYLSGHYYFATMSQGVTTSQWLGNTYIRIAPWIVLVELPIVAFNCEVTVGGEASSEFRIGVWEADGPGGAPNTLASDAGTVATNTAGVKEVTLGSTLTLQPGVYWVGGAVQNAPTTVPTMRTLATAINPGGPMSTSPPGAATQMNGYFGVAAGAFGDFTGNQISSVTPVRIGFKVE